MEKRDKKGDRKGARGRARERAASRGAGSGRIGLGTPERAWSIPWDRPAKGRGTRVFNVHCLSAVLGSADRLGRENSQAKGEKPLEVRRHGSVRKLSSEARVRPGGPSRHGLGPRHLLRGPNTHSGSVLERWIRSFGGQSRDEGQTLSLPLNDCESEQMS